MQSTSLLSNGGLALVLLTWQTACEDGTDRVFRNVGIYKSDAGELPKRKQTMPL